MKDDVFQEFYDGVKREGVSVLVAPTSYGKTLTSPHLLNKARGDGLAYGLIHVVPYRALVKEIYLEKFRNNVYGFKTGYQSMDEIEGGADKDPFFLRDIVVTTLDSYAWNAFGIPVAEFDKVVNHLSQGHGYVASMGIYTSVNVFDEAHVFLGSGSERAVFAMVQAAVAHLARLGVPVAVETATIPSAKLKALADVVDRPLPTVLVCGTEDCSGSSLAKNYRRVVGDRLRVVSDRDWYDRNSFDWRTKLIGEDEALQVVKGLCRDRTVLVIRNTVKSAVETYEGLKKAGCDEVVLLHGLLGARDREKKLEKVRDIVDRGGPGAIVATQVVEAGVEVEAPALVTDAAPIENLAQRAGRLCRSKTAQKCSREGVEVYVVKNENYKGVYDEGLVKRSLEVVETTIKDGKTIDWRLLEDYPPGSGRVSFANLMEQVYGALGGYSAPVKQWALSKALSLDLPASRMMAVLRELLRGELSSTTLVKLAPGGDVENFVPMELGRLSRLLESSGFSRCVGFKNGSVLFKVKLMVGNEERGVDVEVELKQVKTPFDLTNTVYRRVKDEHKLSGVSLRDYYVELSASCYDSERGVVYE
ncbi:CRISPR-associated helicase Cas3' [Thermogladius sp.]|uniref:CRISPR-associated helicase Cas3' n=1 Tax=Thermogladius sp. TaxID=2023064 RepID=UPI003D0F30B8